MKRIRNFMAAGFARACLIAASIALALLSSPVQAQLQGPVQDIGVRPDLLKDVGIDQKLNQSVPLNLTFRDEHGKPVQLGQYFGRKPVILSLVYYNCPMLCTQVLNGLESSLKLIPMDIGKQFDVVTVSIGVCCDSTHLYAESERFVREADAALYAAKRLGRNRVEVATELPVSA